MSTRSIRTALVAAFALVTAAACTQAGDAKANAGSATPGSGSPAPAAPALEGRRVDITAGAEGYSPATVEAKKGETLVLRFTRTTKSDCLSQVVFPGLKITKDLPLNTPVEIGIKADTAGKIPFECGMAMVHGNVNVTDG